MSLGSPWMIGTLPLDIPAPVHFIPADFDRGFG